HNSEVIVDCLFGNGLNRDVQGEPATIIQAINETDATVISIDIASGLDATTGRIRQAAVQADVTLALDCIKKGSLVAQGPQVSGDIRCLDIGIVHEEKDGIPVLDQSWARAHLPARSPFSHKGTFGKALLVGGSQSMPGALSMAARACYAAGIGTLTLMVPDVIADLIAQKIDFAMRLVAPSQEGGFAGSAVDLLKEHLEPYDLIAIGNGMGRTAVTEEMVKAVLESDKPVLLDADAFWAIRNQPHLLKRKAVTMLSPHVKECSYVLNQETKSIQNDVIEAAKEFSALYPDVTLLLKSSISLLSQGQQQCLLHRPNSALAKGGSGDILCGLIAGMYGQSRDAYRSMALAAYIHACCAETKKDPAVAGPDDFIDRINTVIQSLREVK
ncbi:MAG: NAD(P)H-hydrate dehydratase, partial [Erysipelotrichaceae bacterium]|nr:NAD(P)H-hydrate dehydratase [Erysipelotrichaceae bacterium]